MIKFHPSPDILRAFSEGTLSSVESLMVAAHCDMCTLCATQVARTVEDIADEIESVDVGHLDEQVEDTFSAMLATITTEPVAEKVGESQVTTKSDVELDGKRFAVPRSLARYTRSMGNWSGLVGRLWQAPVDLGNHGVANFIYMGKGGSVPEHTHRGTEMTLVIDGEFSDGLNHYRAGDFIYLDGQHTHAPRSDASDGCLVFSIVDQPLHFTSGVARLLNPFSHLFFK